MTFDEARAAHPGFGFAAYCYEPGGAVTLEVLPKDGAPFTFTGPTLQAALDRAFPPEPETPEPPASVFD